MGQTLLCRDQKLCYAEAKQQRNKVHSHAIAVLSAEIRSRLRGSGERLDQMQKQIANDLGSALLRYAMYPQTGVTLKQMVQFGRFELSKGLSVLLRTAPFNLGNCSSYLR